MTNFIFKSQGLIKNVYNKLEMIQAELRHQRADNVKILYLLDKIVVDKHLQQQVDKYFEDDTSDYQEECTNDGPSKTKDLNDLD